MGAETAVTNLAAPRGPICVDDEKRAHCLTRVGEAIRLYEELESALARLDRRTFPPPSPSRRSSFVWEAVAFALGFGLSVLLIVRGA